MPNTTKAKAVKEAAATLRNISAALSKNAPEYSEAQVKEILLLVERAEVSFEILYQK